MEATNITVAQVQEVMDAVSFASRYKAQENSLAEGSPDFFLKALLSPEVVADPIAYRILQSLSSFLKDGMLQGDVNIFETVEAMFANSNSPSISGHSKTTIQELATGLFSHACNALQYNSKLTVENLPYLLKAMAREGGSRWNAYACCGPLLMTRLEAFQPHAGLLLQVMISFPETLSVIHDLYQLAPMAFVENLDLLVKLYESNCNGQLSILDIVRDLAKIHPDLVATHLAALNRIAQKANTDDVAVVKEIEMACASAIPEVQLEEVPQEVGGGDEEEPKDFDEKVEWLNTSAAKCHNLASLRDFLRQNKQAVSYLEDVEKVMPLPVGIDYGVQASESSLKASTGSTGSAGSKSSFKSPRSSMKISKDNLRASRDVKADKDAVARDRRMSDCFGRNEDTLQEFITLRFACATGGPLCATRHHAVLVRANIPPPWLKLAAILYAKSSPAQPLNIQIRKWHPRGDMLDALLEIAQSVEMAAAAKSGGGGGGRPVDGFEVLSCPFLGTDDLGDLIVDLRTDGVFNAFRFDEGTNVWACSACSSSTAPKSKLSGYLVKRGRRLGNKVKRYYMLDDQHLFYATNDHKKKPKRRIPINDIVNVEQQSDNSFEITLRNAKRNTIVLRAPSELQAQRWLLAIRDVITQQSTQSS